MAELAPLSLNLLLADSCSNPDNEWDPNKTWEENQANAEGWQIYRIELHCIEYRISARKTAEGEMDEVRGEWVKAPEYEIRSWSRVGV